MGRRNLAQYFRKNPDWEEYFGQDKPDYRPPQDQPQPPQLQLQQQPEEPTRARKRMREYDTEDEVEDEGYYSDRAERALGPKHVNIGAGRDWVQHQLEDVKRAAQRRQELAIKTKQQEAQEARRWREHSTIQCIIDHYNTGPTTSPRFSELM